MSRFTLVYGDERIPYEVQPDEKRTAKVAIHVNPDGSVNVDAPPGLSEDAIRNAVQKRARWVSTHVAEAKQRHAMVRPREYVSGEQLLYLGRRYVLKVVRTEGQPGPAKMKANRVEVQTRTGDLDDVRGRLRGWYRAKARDYFARRIDDLSAQLPWIDAPPSFRLQSMTRQWGSCSPSGEIILNPDLIKAPKSGVDYVLIHELAHLKHKDHSASFWKLVDAYVPDWKTAKRNLDRLVEIVLTD